MISILDDGGGMGPEAMRRCISFGFSDKKSKTTIGQCKLEIYRLLSIWLLERSWLLAFQMEMDLRPVQWDLVLMLLSSVAARTGCLFLFFWLAVFMIHIYLFVSSKLVCILCNVLLRRTWGIHIWYYDTYLFICECSINLHSV